MSEENKKSKKQSEKVEEFVNLPQNGDNTSRAFMLLNRIQSAMRYLPNYLETCKEILDGVIKEIDAENCSLMLQDPGSGELFVHIARGKNKGENTYYPEQNVSAKRFKSGEGIAGSVLKKGDAIIIDDTGGSPLFLRDVGLNNINSLICFPIMENNKIVGVFNISHSQKDAFGEWEKLAIAYVSTQIGSALTSTRFFLNVKRIDQLLTSAGRSLVNNKAMNVPMSDIPESLMEIGELTKQNKIFIYSSEKMYFIKKTIDQVADTNVNILIQGESGVGKEVVARSIHLNSLRCKKPFIKVNCAALPSNLLESELFGYEKGAFTGAYRRKPGKFELADKGTIFLDEIGEISTSVQSKLLQVIQDKEFSRLGGNRDINVDVRILAATNNDLELAVKQGRFRDDLYFRLNVVGIVIPPLRERKEDLTLLVNNLIRKFNQDFGRNVKDILPEALNLLAEYSWPGNVRELENTIERAAILCEGSRLDLDDFPLLRNAKPSKLNLEALYNGYSLKEAQKAIEKHLITKALSETGGNRTKATQLLEISHPSLLTKIKAYDIPL